MNELVVREWNNQNIRQREDNYVCLTDMCKACGKQLKHWLENKATTEYLKELSSVVGIPTTAQTQQDQGIQALVEINQGGTPELQGTWGHRKVALRLAQWLSPKFAVQVDTWIEELLTNGNVNLNSNIPQDYASSLRLAADEYERRIQAEEKTKQIEGKLGEAEDTLNAYRAIVSPESCLDVTQIAKAIGIPSLGRNNLFDYLRSKSFIQQKPSVVPYQTKIDCEHAVVETYTINVGGYERVKQKTRFTFKGLEWLVKKLKSDRYPVHTDAQAIWDLYNS